MMPAPTEPGRVSLASEVIDSPTLATVCCDHTSPDLPAWTAAQASDSGSREAVIACLLRAVPAAAAHLEPNPSRRVDATIARLGPAGAGSGADPPAEHSGNENPDVWCSDPSMVRAPCR
ncbi:hypothetical protein RHRU231_520011 [Rhodococcus ruber]|uniref:Uncharacterized protein n=1 Tax=Rhodococcus ruber TaxID=1830 RepID=A0A098BN41_9NOCA|nr:hypothetical protein RHRU231_520011 [Rhodococcus ruber]